MRTCKIATNTVTGQKFIVLPDGLKWKSDCTCYGNIVGYKTRGTQVNFTYNGNRKFKRDFVTIEEDVELTHTLIVELHNQYLAEEEAKGNKVVVTTGPRAKNPASIEIH